MPASFIAFAQAALHGMSRFWPVVLSFVDDALLLGLSRLGIVLPGMAWLPTVLLCATILYWSVRVAVFLYAKCEAAEV